MGPTLVAPPVGARAAGIGVTFLPALRVLPWLDPGLYARFANAFQIEEYNLVTMRFGVAFRFFLGRVFAWTGFGVGIVSPRLVEYAGRVRETKQAWGAAELPIGLGIDLPRFQRYGALGLAADSAVQFLDGELAWELMAGPFVRFQPPRQPSPAR